MIKFEKSRKSCSSLRRHMALKVKKILDKLSYEVLSNLTWSSGIFTYNYYPLLSLHNCLCRRKFSKVDVINIDFSKTLTRNTKKFFIS
uniref:Ovule protein n=1 Tax=Strongyloides venezuelensis TaxID=75913 RepID=A0A0K0G5H4_STRVS